MKKTELINTVNDAKHGDRKAFEKLYNEYHSNLYFFVLKNVKNKETAEDITHEAFLKSMEKIKTLEHPENYGTWLHSIAYNKCTDHFRVESRNAYFDTDEEKDFAIENNAMDMTVMLPEDYAINKDRKKEIAALIDGLKPEMRSALILYYYNDMSVSDVAKSLGMNENTAKQKLFQARKKLKTQIEKLYGKGGMLAVVPMKDMFKCTITPKYAAARVAAAPAVSSGFLAGKIAAISAAAVLAICIPVGLGMSEKGEKGFAGDVKMTDSSSHVEVSYNEITDSKAEKKYTVPVKNSESKSSAPITAVSTEHKESTPAAEGKTKSGSKTKLDNNGTANSNAASSTDINTPEKKQNKKITADDLIGASYSEINDMAGANIQGRIISSLFAPYNVDCTAEINGKKWSMSYELSEYEYQQICSDIGSYSQRGWERVSEYGSILYAYVDLSDFDPVCQNARQLSDDANIEPEKGLPYMTVNEMLSMSVDQLKALSDNDYEMEQAASAQGMHLGYKCSAFPEYVFCTDTFGKADAEHNTETYNGNEFEISNTIDQLNLYTGAYVGDDITVGMTYNDIKDKVGDLYIESSNDTLNLRAPVTIDGRTWYIRFVLTQEQEDKVWDRLYESVGGKENFSWQTPGHADISDLNPVSDCAVLFCWDIRDEFDY
jgi:RNA polymerase sigma factor (sigma-70 family)